MLATLVIVFREVLEAGLIVGIVLAATEGVPRRGRYVAIGIAGGVLGATVVALFAASIAEAMEGVGQEVFTAAILLVAVCMLTWHCVWMARHGRELSAEMHEVGRAVKGGSKSLAAMAVVVAVAVLREGSEIVLFLYGIAVSTREGLPAMLAGGIAGLGLAAGVSLLIYRGLLVIPAKYLFNVTNVMIAFLAAGMAGTAAATLAGADLLPTYGDALWDTSRYLSEDSLLGRSLHALIGYSDRPSGVQALAYVATLTLLVILTQTVGKIRTVRR